MKIQEILEKVPDYDVFLTVDEMDGSTRWLAEEYPDTVSVFEAGVSRQGHPILCLKVGDGPLNALCFACPHPNEPIGAMSMEFLSRELAENRELREELGFTWYIIKCIDPDGFRLNEGWLKGPYNIYNYMKHFYRPIGYEQVEWTFPVDYKTLHFDRPLPETRAIMKLIDETRPAFMYSLHNAGFGGAYWYISEDIPELYEDLRQSSLKQGVALNLGEPEAPYLKEFSPAVFQTMDIRQDYDYTEQNTGETPQGYDCGTSSGHYAGTHSPGCVTLLTELPYFFDPRVQDLSPAEISRKEALHLSVDQTREFFVKLEEIVDSIQPYISAENSFIKLVNQSLLHVAQAGEAKKNWADSQPDFLKPATVAQVFDNVQTAKFYNGLSLALTLRACEFEIARLQGSGEPAALARLREAERKAGEFLVSHCRTLEAELDYSVIPIQKLVRVQVESGLIVTGHIGSKHRSGTGTFPLSGL